MKIMKLIINIILCRETLLYQLTTEQRIIVLNRVRRIINAKKYKINLTGSFLNDNEFKLKDKWTIGVFYKYGGAPAILNGRFSTLENNKYKLRLDVSSHFTHLLFTIVVSAIIIYILFTGGGYSSKTEANQALIFMSVFVIIYNLIGNVLKKRLVNKTINELGL